MKIRTDFVSNSSSCSFSISNSNCNKAIKLLKKLGDDINWNLQEDLRISLLYKNKYDKEFFEFLNSGEQWQEPKPFYWKGEWSKPDPEENQYRQIELHQLVNLDDKLITYINEINFSCEDYQDLVKLILSMLFRYLTNHGIECSKDNTEINWDENNKDYENNFIFNLAKEFNKKGKKKNGS